jgi:asparaginyl-tRNA synthetase
MLEAEIAFVDKLDPLLELAEGFVKYVIANSQRSNDWDYLWKDKRENPAAAGFGTSPWPRIKYDDAIKELSRAVEGGTSFDHPVEWGTALRGEHEKWLVGNVAKGPLFVTDYPKEVKPFYMLRNLSTGTSTRSTVANFDLLVPHVLELAGGSLRVHQHALLEEALCQKGTRPQDTLPEGCPYEWYLDLRKYGSAPHGGFGMGFDRLVTWIAGIDSIQDCAPMPRWPGQMLS